LSGLGDAVALCVVVLMIGMLRIEMVQGRR